MRSPKNERHWQNRRRGFDDDNFYGNAPPPMPFPSYSDRSSSVEAQATVKWFNPEKGYGFAALSDGSGDVFLHANALQSAGYQTVSPGATLRVRVAQGNKGRQVEQVISIDESTAERRAGPMQRRPRMEGPREGPRRQVDLSMAEEKNGTVKWYNPDKGFGFITPEGGGKDVFIHATTLERAGLSSLQEGQVVRMSVVQGAKGPEAGSVSLS